MNNKVLNTICAHGLICKGDRVIVALSGGADSVSLLDLLLSLKDELCIEIMAAHVNHNLRGEESDADEAFVRKLCRERGVELFVKSVDVLKLSTQRKEGFETVGRDVRYEFFKELSVQMGAKVATAHTASDALETALMNIARGTSLSGLCSIPYKRDNFIRPLLDVTRAEVEDYVREKGLPFVQDSTNFQADVCNRNRIRHKAVPALKEVNNGAEENFIRLRDDLSGVADFMTQQAEALLSKAQRGFGFDTEVLRCSHPALLSFALKLLIKKSGYGAEHKHIELIKAYLCTGGAVNIGKGCAVVVKQGLLRVTPLVKEERGEFPFSADMSFSYMGKSYFIYELDEKEIVHRKLSSKVISCDKIKTDAKLRSRKAGDRFYPQNRGISKDLRKLQNELKVPSELRDTFLLLESEGEILWAEEIGVSEKGRYTGSKGIYIEIREDKDYA